MISQNLVQLVTLGVLVRQVHGYIPAQASNATGTVDTSKLLLQWYTNGSDWENVAHTLPAGDGAKTTNYALQGILVHFSEENAGNETTMTPWIAFVSCDANSTAPYEVDVFTMAKVRGAKSVLLYSLYSKTCVVNPGYQDSILDVFTTQTLNASRRIEYQFGQFGSYSKTYYGYFNATMLNDAAEMISNSIASNSPVAPGFLFATLPADGASGIDASSSGSQTDANGTETSASTSSKSQDTGVAMIILYAITGCVSALFCGVIITGAIRAIRHPERYGPRPADPTLGGGQSRAGGLGRAILDTFPIVKFGNSGNGLESNSSHLKDIESVPMNTESSIPVPPPNSVQLTPLSYAAEHSELHQDPQEGPVASTGNQEARKDKQSEGTDQADRSPQMNAADHSVPPVSREIAPESIGRETCPICIVDFEEGDDLRVLPCEGKHRFHQSCVDPWLLELSGSCPLCRQDFRALETIISGGPESETPNRNSEPGAIPQHNRRFSRYLRFALGRQAMASDEYQAPPPPPLA